MLGIFEAIGDFFGTIFDLISFLFKGLIVLFQLLTQGISYLGRVFLMLPDALVAAAVVLVVVCVLYKVLGRETQS